MTKKDYIKIAKVLNDSIIGANSHVNKLIGETERETTLWIAKELAEIMKEDNPLFDSNRFMEAVKGKELNK